LSLEPRQARGRGCRGSYWKRLNTLWSKEDDADLAYAVEKLIEAGRARASVHFIGCRLHDGRKFASDLLARALLEAVRQPVDGELKMNDRTMFQHYAEEVFKQLDQAQDVSTDALRSTRIAAPAAV
jgi:glycerol-3-phosphate O-acyltransferase